MPYPKMQNHAYRQIDRKFVNKLFPFKEPLSVDRNLQDVRYYTFDLSNQITRNVIFFPSVTSIIGMESKKVGLQAWKSLVGEEYAKKVSEVTAARGKKLHSICEDYVKGNLFEIEFPDMKLLSSQIFPMLNNIDEYYGIEAPVYSKKWRYAGRVDMFARYKGALSIIDYKTNQTDTSSPAFKEKIDLYFVQMAAYALALEEMFDIKVPSGVIMMASTDYPPVEIARVFKTEKEQFIEMSESFHKKGFL